jgi:hypothetical protein
MLTLFCRIRPTVFLSVTNASFTLVMHLYDDCSAVLASISEENSSASICGHF